jgi:hypothetical protein
VRRLIHGHTHRPAVHALRVDGRPAVRVVLATGMTRVRAAGGCRRVCASPHSDQRCYCSTGLADS